MAEERPPAPSEESMPKKGKAEYSQARTLIDDVLSQWTWIKDLNSNLAAMVPLRDYVTTYREAAWRVGTNLREAAGFVQHQWDTMMEPSEATKGHWEAALAFRRKHPSLIVAAATGISVLPALLRFRESRLTAARLLARNSIIGGGAAAVLLYPELIFRTAPYVSRGVNKANNMVASIQASASRGRDSNSGQ